MKKVCINKKIYTLVCGIMIFVFWFLAYSRVKNDASPTSIENIALFAVGLICMLEFIFIKETFYELVIITFVPFVFSHPFYIGGTPICVYIALGMAILGLIIHIIRFREKVYVGKMFFGLLLFSLTIIIGGLGNEDNKENLFTQFYLMTIMVVSFMLFYVFFSTYTEKCDFDIICTLMNVLALILILECFTFSMLADDFLSTLERKSLDVGWGNTNNISIMLLFTMPFAFYMAAFGKKKLNFLYVILLIIEYIVIFFTYSRGCILFGGIGIVIMLLLGIIHLKKKCIPYAITVLFVIGAVALLIYLVNKQRDGFFEKMIASSIGKVNLDTFNGRFEIYIEWFNKSFDHFVLGHGMYYPLVFKGESGSSSYVYSWGHNTFLHTFFTLGFVGFLALLYHMFEKYYGVIRKINGEKLALLLAFSISGLYGLIDVSYFFVNYMVVLIMVLVLSDGYMESVPYFDKLTHFKKKEKKIKNKEVVKKEIKEKIKEEIYVEPKEEVKSPVVEVKTKYSHIGRVEEPKAYVPPRVEEVDETDEIIAFFKNSNSKDNSKK